MSKPHQSQSTKEREANAERQHAEQQQRGAQQRQMRQQQREVEATMTMKSINEPDTMALPTLGIPSINEPPALQDKPVLASLTPDSCTIGDPDFTLYVSGDSFTADSVIVFAGHDEPTTLEEDGTLSTGVNMDVWQGPDIVQCQVRNGVQTSEPLDFEFLEPPAARGRRR